MTVIVRLHFTNRNTSEMYNSGDEARADDSEESLITQFETTLTIRPTSNDVEDEDISIDHTAVPYDTTMGTVQEDHHYKEASKAQLAKIKAEKSSQVQPKLAKDRSTKLTEAKTILNEGQYEDLLRASPLIDYSLIRFNKVFSEFLKCNPHIEEKSPRYPLESDKTLVVLSPFSAEHAFGRKWVSKSYLATIFERPQRLLASCIGVCAAITMYPFFYLVINSVKRGSLMASHVRKVHGKTWPKTLFGLCIMSHEKLEKEEIEVPEDWNTGDIYLTPKTINALEGVLGTIETSIDSLYDLNNPHDLVFVVVRPPGHHSHACLPSGFCLLNNIQIAAQYAFERHGVTHCAILDIDLHHGDGTQDICWERAGFEGDYGKPEDDELDEDSSKKDEFGKSPCTYPKVGYFSLHDIKSYPTELGYASKEKIKNASTCIMDHDLNIWNIHLQEWSTEEEFYKHYRTKYVNLLNRANQFLNQAKRQHEKEYQEYSVRLAKYNKYLSKPHLFNQPMEKPREPPKFKPVIAISAGFDALEYENPLMQRNGVNVPSSFYAAFTKDVVKLARIHTEGKIVSFLEGGYSDGALSTGIFSHLIGLTKSSEDDSLVDSLWNPTWGSEQVMKELVKGCRTNWFPYKRPQTDITIWANEVIKLGRSMMPNAILPASYIYLFNDKSSALKSQPSKENYRPTNRMLREVLSGTNLPQMPRLVSDDDTNQRDTRHTRSYYKKLASAQKLHKVLNDEIRESH